MECETTKEREKLIKEKTLGKRIRNTTGEKKKKKKKEERREKREEEELEVAHRSFPRRPPHATKNSPVHGEKSSSLPHPLSRRHHYTNTRMSTEKSGAPNSSAAAFPQGPTA